MAVLKSVLTLWDHLNVLVIQAILWLMLAFSVLVSKEAQKRLHLKKKNCCYRMTFYSTLDTNECETDVSGCQHNCTNSVGSFECSCRLGYSLDSGGRLCSGKMSSLLITIVAGMQLQPWCTHHTNYLYCYYSDIDECESDGGGCEHSCVNLPGSFECFCRQGYSLATDGFNCNGRLYYFTSEFTL